MNSTRYTDEVCCFYYYRLKLQIKILQYLKGLGFYTIYKSHPDRLLEIGNLMNDFTDEYENSKFENIWEKAVIRLRYGKSELPNSQKQF